MGVEELRVWRKHGGRGAGLTADRPRGGPGQHRLLGGTRVALYSLLALAASLRPGVSKNLPFYIV